MISIQNISSRRQLQSIDNDSSDDSASDTSATERDVKDINSDLGISRELVEREKKYRLLNSKLKSKTDNVVKHAETLLKEGLKSIDRPHSAPRPDATSEHPTSQLRKRRSQTTSKQSSTSTLSSQATLADKKSTPASSTTTLNSKSTLDLPISETDVLAKITEKLNTTDLGNDVGIGGASLKEAEIGLEATNRYLKARLAVIHEEFMKLAKERKQQDATISKLQDTLRSVETEKNKLSKQHTNVTTILTKNKKQNEDLKSTNEKLLSEVNSLRKELETFKRETKQNQNDKSTKDVKLNRALEEIEKWKSHVATVSSESKDTIDTLKKTVTKLQAENKRLEKQKSEVLLAFKKQLMLIDVLKKQKMHIEAAKLLSFTEEEFVKVLNWKG